MHLTIRRDQCWHQLSACEECFADFLRTGQPPERGCIGQLLDDGAPELVVKFVTGKQVGTLVITERNRARVIYEGWTKFVRMTPPRIEPAAAQKDASAPKDSQNEPR
jgi:hypothetical protein